MMMQNGETINNDLDKANVFNRYFYSVFTQEDLSDLDSLKQSLDHHSLLYRLRDRLWILHHQLSIVIVIVIFNQGVHSVQLIFSGALQKHTI